MSGKITSITSPSQFDKLLSSATYTIVDFYADWCGPCKTIAPVFANLASKESKPGKLQFCKVDVDAQQEIARRYGVSAMPTFLVLKSSTVVETIRGANPSALTAAVRKAANDSASGPGTGSAAFSSKGHTLGSASQPSRAVNQGAFSWARGLLAGDGGLMDTVVRFAALYFVSLFALDGYGAAGESGFSVRGRR